MQRISQHRNNKFVALLLTTALVGVLTSSLATAAVSPKAETGHATKTVKPDYAYFKGKTITIYTNAITGNAYALSELFKPMLQAQLDATINITPIAGNSIFSNNDAANASPNGLNVGWIGLGNALTQFYFGTDPYTFNLKKETYIASVANGAEDIVSCTGSKYTTLDQVRTATTPVSILAPTGTSSELLEHMILSDAYNNPTKYIEGYLSGTTPVGCQRGDGDLTLSNVNAFTNAAGTAMVPGETALLLIGNIPKGGPGYFLQGSPTVPSLTQYIKEYPPKTPRGKEAMKLAVLLFNGLNQTFFGPAGMPQKYLLVWRQVMKKDIQSAIGKVGLAALDIAPGYYPPQDAITLINQGLKRETLIKGFLYGYP